MRELDEKWSLFGPNRNGGVRPSLPEVPQEFWVTEQKVKVSSAFSCCRVSSEMTRQREEGSLGGTFEGINQIRWQLHNYLHAGTWDWTFTHCHLWKINNVLQTAPGQGATEQCGPLRFGLKKIKRLILQREKNKWRQKHSKKKSINQDSFKRHVGFCRIYLKGTLADLWANRQRPWKPLFSKLSLRTLSDF